MNILVTGAAGFVGMHTTKKLIEAGHRVIGIDNLNNYYDPSLKYARLRQLGISTERASVLHESINNRDNTFTFVNEDICNRTEIDHIFTHYQFTRVVHLAAQAGVQYSLQNPDSYIKSNMNGFYEILDACRRYKTDHLIFASSSSVYGKNHKYPYAATDQTDQPTSLYAATKKSNELMAYAYAYTHSIRTTALRFFTVYGPWGRPDMAPFIFTDAILHDRPIRLNNKGDMWRDFTYIDDIVNAISMIIEKAHQEPKSLFEVYNIGNSHPVSILELVRIIENITGKSSSKILSGFPLGDVLCTYADITPIMENYGWHPTVSLEEGMKYFIKWYNDYSIDSKK